MRIVETIEELTDEEFARIMGKAGTKVGTPRPADVHMVYHHRSLLSGGRVHPTANSGHG